MFPGEILAVTFATTRNSVLYKNYSTNVERLEASLGKYGIPLVVYNPKKLKPIIDYIDSKLYLLYNKGVGAWFWKPLIISDLMTKHNSKIILYLDADCVVTKDPSAVISKLSPDEYNLYLFQQNLLTKDWTSKRCISLMGISDKNVLNSRMKTAGVIVARSSAANISNLKVWSNHMRDPRKLVDQVSSREFHRHDQSILSLLCASGKIQSKSLGSGFFSNGPESACDSLTESWVYTGNIDSSFTHQNFFKKWLNFLRYLQFQIMGYMYKILIYPVQIILLLKNSS
jgi:hypothetical protein